MRGSTGIADTRGAEWCCSRSPGGASRPASAHTLSPGGIRKAGVDACAGWTTQAGKHSPTGCSPLSDGNGGLAPEGFRPVRVHALKHAWGRRLRAAGAGVRGSPGRAGLYRQERCSSRRGYGPWPSTATGKFF